MKKGIKVIVVDDDPGVIFLHKIIIRESGLCKTPESFDEAKIALTHVLDLQKNQENKILIFLDINMPYMNGWDFLKKLSPQANPDQIKVIMVTSSLSISDREKAKAYKMVYDFLEKPLMDTQCHQIKEKLNGWVND